MEPIVIAFSKMEDGKKIKTIVTQSGYSVRALCTTASQVLSICDDIKSGIVIHGFRFPDMLYEELGTCPMLSLSLLVWFQEPRICHLCFDNPPLRISG